uniref:Polycystin cation channel PKD1/PKD2 domain-containing protein n=1 Tax=Chlamydomonas leiostraca TaxID=1034604 RepID=A0A7S0NBN4_9CHLO|mmetsp:Transcript_10686/g.26368  ORF Transcript_10686/g.26368 Transcript_10686/m.26368 type:complete len:1658 (+) Transcript_10686:162-5135(+)|eukprot:CAMPEP_0202857024 /NCGR_PEP_ID=MMETSP1391-20130828/115_1 /ASSEMBLY_ACC=CAM_ASM_000867 /TAXON_ID=1034604 /ORGANISM="Chlamydomonas leiostraca, Strain SAG 11-49" /LENGTH=1657 /DNA_ID=CAMNT_0049535769 /DNA_START=98 /DNA_END=5071 /DNA_ORIENTATION=-
MKKFGAVRAAMSGDDNPQEQAVTQAPEDQDANRFRMEEGDGTSHAQRIVKELYLRYQKQLQRWRDYRNLFFFLAFVALFLAVLYTQRQANTAFKVHATLSDVLVPSDTVMGSTDDVYQWLKDLLNNVWVDPKCGDGLCESPFEFASYSRFGCRADCGKLQDVQKLTTVQIDVYFDFSHPIGSIPASDLMQQTSYNLCPVKTMYSGDCYYDSDIKFDRLSGSTTTIISDMPDGEWDLIMRRDIFMKTRGAVRDFAKLTAASYYYRVYLAALSAIAEQNTEMMLLNQAIAIATGDVLTYTKANLQAINGSAADFVYEQLLIATCSCKDVPISDAGGAITWYNNGIVDAFNNSNGGFKTWEDFNTQVCTPQGYADPTKWADQRQDTFTEYCVTQTGVCSETQPTAGVQFTTKNVTRKLGSNSTELINYCGKNLNQSLAWRNNQTTTVQRLMIDLRLGDGKTTGKIKARNTIYGSLRNNLIQKWPELFDPIFTAPRGSVAIGDMANARVDVLQEQFVLGVTYFTSPQPAFLNITRRTIYASNVTMQSIVERAHARINETRFQQRELLGIAVPRDTNYNYSYPDSITVEELLKAFHAALGVDPSSPLCANSGCTPVQLLDDTTIWLPNGTFPDANNTNLNQTFSSWAGKGLQTAYNLISWDGNTTAYMVANLDVRGPAYLGTCTSLPVSCLVNQNNDTVPYNCTDLSTGAPVPGNLSDISYRQNCEANCDRKLDCNTLCECYGTCTGDQMCLCEACDLLNKDAASDSSFVDISSVATAAANSIADLSQTGIGGGRKLKQDTTSQLTAVLTQVGQVKTQQDNIASQMTKLQTQVDRANQLAEARANDNRLIDLIQAGRQDIAAGQARVESKLDEIIGKQNASLAAAEAATAALNAIQGLAQRQLAAQQALEKAVQNQLTAIKTATYQGIISLTQALALWKRARRDRALTLKAAQLANIPCTMLPTSDNVFTLDNGNFVDNTTARERNIGLTNRVISGMLLHQFRTNDTNCTESKFSKIQQTCTGPVTLKSFGVDPVFKLGTTLYNPDYDDVNGDLVVQFYNCSLLTNPTYNVSFQNMTTNAAPYCAELYNSQGLPYAFHHFPLRDKTPGFPVFFDINLSQDGASTWETYLEEGLFLDQHTRQLTAEVVTYNAPLRIFGYFYVKFFFSDGGSIKVTYRLHTVRVELYNGYEDDVRFAFEIILTIWIFCMMLWTFYQILKTQREKKNFLKFFAHGWNWVDFISNGLLTACMIIWWIFKEHYAKKFDTSLRHDVYADLTPPANFLALNKEGTEMVGAWEEMHDLKDLIDMLNWYFALNGINILLLIARVLRLMDFQPRLGVVTRSLWLAGPDLIHFAIVAGMVFVGYAMMAHLIFGNAIEKFQTFGDSVNTCFEILLGNIDVNQDLRALGGLQSVAGALFFWSYELLVFMVLLNFLLAIIVDAFSEVKEKTHETVGIHTELYQLLRDKWRSLLGSCSANYISDAKLGALLKQWAGDDEDEDKKAVQGDVSKLLTILNEDLDEEDLRNVLMECLKDAPGHDEAAKAAQPKGIMRFLPQRRRVVASPQEVAQAAKYIVDRFGVPVEAEEEVFGGMDAGAAGGGMDAGGGMGLGGPAMDKERDQLAGALERLADVQRELAEGQRNLMSGQKQLAEQQAKLVTLMNTDQQ